MPKTDDSPSTVVEFTGTWNMGKKHGIFEVNDVETGEVKTWVFAGGSKLSQSEASSTGLRCSERCLIAAQVIAFTLVYIVYPTVFFFTS